MKSKKNIETAFREKAKDLTIQPSAQAWSKLERRLDSRPSPKGVRRRLYTWVAIAATLLVLIASLLTGNKNLHTDYAPTVLEVLDNPTGCHPYCLLIKGRKALPAFYSVPEKDELPPHS
ncbi:MAG TPA: hypothetical protein ENJ20_00675 [Bacteroidetes bacterium]|nr:hypothetical protein [Bacteroidota bacterium]